MKTFRTFILENPWINDLELDADMTKHPKQPPRPPDLDLQERGKYVGTMGDSHVIYKKPGNAPKHPGDLDGASYYLVNHKTNNVEMAVHGEEKGNKFFVNGLGGYAGAKYKAHEFYHHLITKHGIHLHSDYEQSSGGMKVWKALHKMPGIHMQSFNGSTEKYSELKPSFQRTYDMDSSTRLAAKKK